LKYACKIWFSRLLIAIGEPIALKINWIPTQYGIDLLSPVKVNKFHTTKGGIAHDYLEGVFKRECIRIS
jgi:hypothetical protein